MGLDMYAMATSEKPNTDVDFEVHDANEFYYWRKHPNLHGWMEVLYHSKGGSKEFNCTTVQLTADDLQQLEHDILADKLPETSGFFFGNSDGSEKQSDLKFIAEARALLAQGLTIYYDSWW